MEKSNDHSSEHKSEGDVCRRCNIVVGNGECQCPGPPSESRQVAQKILWSHLLSGTSLLTHTKSNVSQVPDSIVILKPSSETKTKESSTDETKLPLSKVKIGNECLNYPKEAVNVGSSSNVGSKSNIFEIDFDCVDSTMIVRNESSHATEDKQRVLEKTPVKKPRKVSVPTAPQKQSSGPSNLNDHGDYASRGPRHACPFCSKTFWSNGKLNTHLFSHTGERPFACKHCHKAFSSKFKLCRHVLIHSEERKFLCTVCERRFIRNDHLKNHYKVHDPRKVLFRCERVGCEKKYSSAISQRKHEAWHRAQDGDLKCLLCNVKHENVADLLVHLRRHSGSRMLKSPADRKFRCHLCERHFLTRKDVTRHLVVHTGERDFLCQFCPQRFGRKDHLIRHIKKSHHGPSRKKGCKRDKSKDGSEEQPMSESDIGEGGGEDEDDEDEDQDEDEDNTVESGLDESSQDHHDSKVPSDLEEIETSELLMREPSPSPSPAPENSSQLSKPVQVTEPTSILESRLAIPVDVLSPKPSTSTSILQAPVDSDVLAAPSLLPSDMRTAETEIDLFGFETHEEDFDNRSSSMTSMMPPSTSTVLTSGRDKKDGDLFEGTCQNLMFGEPSFDEEEFKSTDFLLNEQGEPQGELLRYLLQSDADAPLPAFNKIFQNCPPNS